MSRFRMGIDVGGTFTDVIGRDDATGAITVRKALTTPDDFPRGVTDGLAKLYAAVGRRPADPGLLVHGTTIGTNALLERKGARVALLTNFRDVLEIGRIQRPAAGLYDMNVDNPEPLVPRRLRLAVRERVGSRGEVVEPLDEEGVRAAFRAIHHDGGDGPMGVDGVEAVAVCFLFSFLNPAHERRAREIAREEMPGVPVTLSSDVAPEFREFERTSTTVLSAYLQPVVERYVSDLARRLRDAYPGLRLRLVQANGGVMRPEAVAGRAVNLLNSGPAGGATAAAFLGREAGEPNLVSVDMGGTSFDVSTIAEGAAAMTTEAKVDGYPVKIPITDVNVIGAGGGSIAWLDAGGALNVGPRSAAANPGPACYGLGGTEPTVTDANVVLGRIAPDYFLGGEMPLRRDLAEEAIREQVAEPLGLSIEEAAAGIVRVVNANMAKAIAVSSVQRGLDLRDFALLAFGGAGPLHAADLAADLGMKSAIIPPFPGAFSAFGLLVADARHDFVRAVLAPEDRLDPGDLARIFRELEAEGLGELARDGVPPRDRAVRWSADLRFEGQSYELNIPVPRRPRFSGADLRRLLRDFAATHERLYSFRAVDEKTVLVNARVTALGRSPRMRLPPVPRGRSGPRAARPARKGERRVLFGPGRPARTAIYERRLLGAGAVVPGPAVVEEEISCTVVPPGQTLRVDPLGNLVVRP